VPPMPTYMYITWRTMLQVAMASKHADVHLHDAASHGLDDQEVAQHHVDDRNKYADEHFLSKGKTATAIVHLQCLLEKPRRDVKGQTARNPFQESAVFAGVYILIRAVRLRPGAERGDLGLNGLRANIFSNVDLVANVGQRGDPECAGVLARNAGLLPDRVT
jgi:hypothetical protein